MDIVRSLEEELDNLISKYQNLKEENEKLWQELEEAQSKIERLEEEKKQLEDLLEEQQRSLNRMRDKILGLLSSTSQPPENQEMMWGGNENNG